eukprot:gene4956-6646_t
MPHADHAQACARRAKNDRHDVIADLCAMIYHEAGNAAHRETEVPGVLSKQNKGPIRTDVLVRSAAPALWECAEVKVRHFFKSDGTISLPSSPDVDSKLRATEAQVHEYYRP